MSLADDWFDKAMADSFNAFEVTAVNTVGEIVCGREYIIEAHYKFRFADGVSSPECIRYRVSKKSLAKTPINKGTQIYRMYDIDYTELCYCFSEEEIFIHTLKGNIIPYEE